MEISEIKRIAELLQKVNCECIALVSEVAKEMGVKKTALMQFIEDNPKLFKLDTYYTYTKRDRKVKGLAISKVYLTPEENPDTEEWMEKMRKAWDKKIHIGEQTYYGYHEYFCIPEDDADSKEGKYRNTPEKIKFLEEKGIIKKVIGGYGGLSDYYRTEYYPYSEEVQKALEGIGWTTDFNVNERSA
jgi:ribosome-binding factor A